MRNVSNRSCRENQNTHFYVRYLFSGNGAFYAEKHDRARQAADYNMAARMLDK
jgi:hypothetical protein